jgi:hypothetical protein
MDRAKISQAIPDLPQPLNALDFQTLSEQFVEKYKITKCVDTNCKYNQRNRTDNNLLYDCFFYHHRTDQRRPVFIRGGKNYRIISLNYSEKVGIEIVRGHKPNNFSEVDCLNGFEYLYHPLNYKTVQCRDQKCNTIFCPYFHSEDEKTFFEGYRTKIEESLKAPI